MFFIVDTNKKIIFGWSAKCGCSHIKTIFWFLQTDNLVNQIHTEKDYNKLPNDIENYITIIFIRNPYKRIISGFLDKYKKKGEFRHLWKNPFLSFSQFVDKLINCDWKIINHHHFTPQTTFQYAGSQVGVACCAHCGWGGGTEQFDKKILLSKSCKFYDIGKIDYEYIEQLYNKKIPKCIINKKHGHERLLNVNVESDYNDYVYDLHIDDYIDYNIDIKYFYNKDIKEKVFNFYINDFIFFKENSFDYINSAI
jgi:hypothetical protein